MNSILVEIETQTPNRQLGQIRMLSNIIAALENVVVQCEGHAEFETLVVTATQELEELRVQLKRAIHAY